MRDQVAYSEPAEFLVDVAVPVVVGAEVAAIVALGGSTLPLDTTRSGLELLAAYAAAHVRGIDAGARVDRLLNTVTDTKVRVKTEFTVGESVKIINGPLSDFTGEIAEVNAEAGRLRVLVSIFGRETPAELAFEQVKKLG